MPDPRGYVDPAWAPPVSVGPGAAPLGSTPAGRPSVGGSPAETADRRPGWLPLLAVALVTIMVAGGLYLAERFGGASQSGNALSYLPPDGATLFRQRDTTIGRQTASSTFAEESAAQTGGVVLGGLDSRLADEVIRVLGGTDGLDRMRFWRTTGTLLHNLGSSQQHVRVLRVDGPIELIAESDRDGADVYRPALVELPATVAPGDSWSSAGTIGSRLYRSEFSAEAGRSGCLDVAGSVVESTSAGQATVTREVRRTWCPGQGVTAEEVVRGDVTIRTATVAAPAADPELRTADEPLAWSDPTGWRQREFGLISADASLGSGPMAGAPSQVSPVVTTSGLVFRPTSGDDLVATTPKLADRWTTLWRMHPGGTLMSAAAFGDVVVATTSRREVVAWSDAGIRLWTVRLDDVAFRDPVRVDERRIAVADAAGSVRVLDLLTGHEAWRARVDGQIAGPLAADPRVVVVVDAGGSTTAYAAQTGERRWRKDLTGSRATVSGDVVVVHNQATLEGLDLTTGRRRWLLPISGTLDVLQPFGDTVVASSQLETLVLDRDGTLLHRLPSYEWVTVAGDTMVGWGRTEAEFRDTGYALLRTIDTPDLSLTSALRTPLAYRQGVIVFGQGWSFTTWSDEP